MALRDTFDAIDLATIQAYVTDQREEDLHLDFKNVQTAALTRDDRKTFSVALSGFANSDGGIIIWGVDARPNAQGVDCASALNEINNARQCLTRLNDLTGQLVSPIVDGVAHRAILSVGDAGFCASLVPPSDRGPHMAGGGEDRYYKRSGSSFYRLEHFDVADMFGRRGRSALTVALMPERAGRYLRVVLKNEGRAPARSPYIALNLNAGYRASPYGVDGNGNFGLKPLEQADMRCSFGADATKVIHVGQQLAVTRLEARAITAAGLPIVNGVQRFEFEIAAEDVSLAKGHVDV